MVGVAPYVVAVAATLFAGFSALTLIYVIEHFDSHESASLTK
jgi:hypothetical protein